MSFKEHALKYSINRPLQIAGAGNHSMLIFAPTSVDILDLAHQLIEMMPKLTQREQNQLTAVYGSKQTTRPLRVVTPKTTLQELTGGGQQPNPGELSYAHTGILILKNIEQFKKNWLQMIRDVLFDGKVTFTRASQAVTYPAAPLIIASVPACQCDNWGDKNKTCTCTPEQRADYSSKFTSETYPFLQLTMLMDTQWHRRIEFKKNESKIACAKKHQNERFGNTLPGNASLTQSQITEFCPYDEQGRDVQRFKDHNPDLWPTTLKLARTIADLKNEADINANHITEAYSWRA